MIINLWKHQWDLLCFGNIAEALDRRNPIKHIGAVATALQGEGIVQSILPPIVKIAFEAVFIGHMDVKIKVIIIGQGEPAPRTDIITPWFIAERVVNRQRTRNNRLPVAVILAVFARDNKIRTLLISRQFRGQGDIGMIAADYVIRGFQPCANGV